ncbi:hypothetical protein [Hymenobacter metallicola]|uniref:Uncharacterized protein n=1 Tax=Hymenobacter metallicola TaxID=2563114 RepID=A0A4Z0PYK0_9BACT|nr:hypothetical protein [Hymenobacter metallicola]TGE22797.1 hypothetical protein E5K02_20750 [Hymenobacter metallicola]
MHFLSTAAINPSLVLLPSRMLARTACEFWLSNPLLIIQHTALVEERTEQYPGWSEAEQRKLATRLSTARDKAKNIVPVKPAQPPMSELLAELDAHETVIEESELRQARHLAMTCHPLERSWLLAHFRSVLKARLVVMEEQHEQDEEQYEEAA